VLIRLNLSRGNISYSIVVGWLCALVSFISNISDFLLCVGLSCLGMIWGYLLIVGTYYINVVRVVPVCTSLDFTNKW
jgi:hypothetical protein